MVPGLAQRVGALQRALLLRIRLIRVLASWLQARLWLASAAPGADLRPVARLADRLAGERIGYASVYAALVRAALALGGRVRDEGAAAAWLDEAAAAAERSAMASCAAAARYRRAALVGGNEGATLHRAALVWAEQERVVRPERYFELIAPGFAAAAGRREA
jgi:hypothetical protein